MSSILDALKKSEADRQRAAGPNLLDVRVQPARRGLPTWVLVLGVLLLGNGALLAWLLLRHSGGGAAPVAAAVPAAASAPAAQVAAAPGATPGPTPGATPGAAAPGPAQRPATEVPAGGEPAAQGRVIRPPAPDLGNPADDEPASETPAPRTRRPARASGELPTYSSISATLPAMHLDLHFWSEVPAERYALINLHRVGEGDTLPEGPRVLEITRDGVVLEYQDREFLLGRE